MVKTGFFIMGLLVLAVGFAVPDVTQSDSGLSDCIENCRSTFDPDKDMESYSACVESCRDNHSDENKSDE